jgi:hypothetical protein
MELLHGALTAPTLLPCHLCFRPMVNVMILQVGLEMGCVVRFISDSADVLTIELSAV